MLPVACEGCGAKFRVKEEHAGRQTVCPKCRGPIHVPVVGKTPTAQTATGAADTEPIAFNCQCGRRILARNALAGRAAECPACGERLVVPHPSSLGATDADLPELTDLDVIDRTVAEMPVPQLPNYQPAVLPAATTFGFGQPASTKKSDSLRRWYIGLGGLAFLLLLVGSTWLFVKSRGPSPFSVPWTAQSDPGDSAAPLRWQTELNFRGRHFGIVVREMKSGKVLHRFEGPIYFHRENATAFSPGRRYLAAFAGERSAASTHVLLYDLKSGAAAGAIELPEGDWVNVAVAFAPGGDEVSAFIGDSEESRLLVWKMENGGLASTHALPGDLFLATSIAAKLSKTPPLQWLPSGKGWLVNGHWLIQRSSGRVVWQLGIGSDRSKTETNPRLVLPSGQIQISDLSGRPAKVTIPWPKIEASLKAMAQADAHVRPGQAVSLQIEVGNVALSSPGAIRSLLVDVLTKKLARNRIRVADNQPTTLIVYYSEKAGRTLHEGNNPAFLDPNAQTVQATAVSCRLIWKAAGKRIWSNSFSYESSGGKVRLDRAEADIRAQAVEQVVKEIMAEPFPYFIPKDDSLVSLPLYFDTRLLDRR